MYSKCYILDIYLIMRFELLQHLTIKIITINIIAVVVIGYGGGGGGVVVFVICC